MFSHNSINQYISHSLNQWVNYFDMHTNSTWRRKCKEWTPVRVTFVTEEYNNSGIAVKGMDSRQIALFGRVIGG